MVQNLYKNWPLVSKIIWEIWITSYKQWKVQKVEIERLHLSKKHILSAKTYTEDLSNINFNYLCENSPNSIYHFWNHKLFFPTQLVSIILAQTLHTFHKNIPSKYKFSDFPLLELKFIKFLMSFFKQKVRFSSKFGSLFSVMRDNSSALIYAIDKSSTSKWKFSDFPLLALKFTKFVMSFLKPRASFSSNFASFSTVMRDNSAVLFHLKLYMLSTKGTHQVQIFSQLLALKLTKFLVIFQATSQFSLQLRFGQKEPMKVQIFKFLNALMKVHPIPHASFETRSKVKVYSNFASLFTAFFISNLNTLGKKSPSKWNFQTFEWLGENSPNSLSCLKLQASFSLNFSSLQCHGKLFHTFLAETVHAFDKRSPSKCKISVFPLLM